MFPETEIMHKTKSGSIRYLPFLGHKLTEEENNKVNGRGKRKSSNFIIFFFQEIIYFYIFFSSKYYMFSFIDYACGYVGLHLVPSQFASIFVWYFILYLVSQIKPNYAWLLEEEAQLLLK